MKQVKMYKSENGKVFETEEEAVAEENLCKVEKIINNEIAYGDTLCCSSRELAEKIDKFYKKCTTKMQ